MLVADSAVAPDVAEALDYWLAPMFHEVTTSADFAATHWELQWKRFALDQSLLNFGSRKITIFYNKIQNGTMQAARGGGAILGIDNQI